MTVEDRLDPAGLVRRDVPVADPHHPDLGRLAALQPSGVGGAHGHGAGDAGRRRPSHVTRARAVARVEEARIPALGRRLTRLQRQHGRAVVASIRHHLLQREDVLHGGGGAQRVLRLVVVLECPSVVVRRLLVEILGEGVHVQVGQLLAQDGHVLVGHAARDPPPVDRHQLLLTAVPGDAQRVPRDASTLRGPADRRRRAYSPWRAVGISDTRCGVTAPPRGTPRRPAPAHQGLVQPHLVVVGDPHVTARAAVDRLVDSEDHSSGLLLDVHGRTVAALAAQVRQAHDRAVDLRRLDPGDRLGRHCSHDHPGQEDRPGQQGRSRHPRQRTQTGRRAHASAVQSGVASRISSTSRVAVQPSPPQVLVVVHPDPHHERPEAQAPRPGVHLGEELRSVRCALGLGDLGAEALVEPEQPFQLVDRTGVVIHSQVHLDVVASVRACLVPHDEERRGLAPSRVATGFVTCAQGHHQAFGQGGRGIAGDEGVLHRDHDLLAGEDVPLDGVPVAGHSPSPFQALRAGVTGGPALCVDDPHLAVLPPVVRIEQPLESCGSRGALPEVGEGRGLVGHVDPGLGGHRAHAGAGSGDRRAHGEVLGRDGDAPGPTVVGAGHDRERHVANLASHRLVRQGVLVRARAGSPRFGGSPRLRKTGRMSGCCHPRPDAATPTSRPRSTSCWGPRPTGSTGTPARWAVRRARTSSGTSTTWTPEGRSTSTSPTGSSTATRRPRRPRWSRWRGGCA